MILRYRALLNELVSRDLKVKYRRSVLGYLWSILNPLLMMLVISAVFSYIFENQITNYAAYLICGQVIYQFFSESTNQAMKSVISGESLIKKVRIPKYIFPVAATISSFVNLLFSLVAVIIILFVSGAQIKFTILFFPLPLIYLVMISMGVGLILSILAVYFRDMLHLYGVVLTALMYATPIFYPIDSLPPHVIFFLKFNPLYHIVDMFRNVVLYGNIPTVEENVICMAFAAISLMVGFVIFKRYQDKLVLNL
ncbi:ABC transporter permease [Paenibacillus ginsengarvi]|uniref:Transport permease protein n=2 Tax=Paenibacillus ginsengarvi TaxID=400777 RepID=A0A3B0C8F0_9BACL|nr:ABC transporter permease [Paenibacillus ginsengarvi]